MKSLLFLAKAGSAFYLTVLVLLFVFQGRLLFPVPPPRNLVLADGAARADIVTPDGETLRAIHFPAPPGAPSILFFHGNGASAEYEYERGRALRGAGYGVLLAEYRGYGGSTGMPSAAGLLTDALAAHDWLAARSDRPIIVYAHSLGAGLAVQAAAQRDVAALALEASYASLADIAAERYWWLPVRPLFRNPIRAVDQIAMVKAPILMIHGGRDTVIPIRHGRALHAAAGGNAEWIEIDQAGHNDLPGHGSIGRVLAFLERVASY
jgi:hypothetical protein